MIDTIPAIEKKVQQVRIVDGVRHRAELDKYKDALAWCLTILEGDGIPFNPDYKRLVQR